TVETSPGNRRVLPDGDYTLVLAVEDQGGARIEKRAPVRVRDADTTPVAIQELRVAANNSGGTLMTPNSDGNDDEVRITYQVTKAAEITVYVTDEQGNHYIIDPPTKRNPSLLSHLWDGTTGGRIYGGKLL